MSNLGGIHSFHNNFHNPQKLTSVKWLYLWLKKNFIASFPHFDWTQTHLSGAKGWGPGICRIRVASSVTNKPIIKLTFHPCPLEEANKATGLSAKWAYSSFNLRKSLGLDKHHGFWTILISLPYPTVQRTLWFKFLKPSLMPFHASNPPELALEVSTTSDHQPCPLHQN